MVMCSNLSLERAFEVVDEHEYRRQPPPRYLVFRMHGIHIFWNWIKSFHWCGVAYYSGGFLDP